MQLKGLSIAFSALGNNAYNHEKNQTKAIEYWEEGWNKYKDKDCAYSLGSLWDNGLYLNKPKDLVKLIIILECS